MRIRGLYAGGNPEIETALHKWHTEGRKSEKVGIVMDTIVAEMKKNLEVITPVVLSEECPVTEEESGQYKPFSPVVNFLMAETADHSGWMAAFTDEFEFSKGADSSRIPILFSELIEYALQEENCAGIVINPFGEYIYIPKIILERMLQLSMPVPQDVLDLDAGSHAYQEGDFETAVRLYRKAAEAGNVTALSNLGYCYYYGRSIPTDKEKARECWEKAAVLGDICAVYKLGDLYRNGDLPEDPVFSGKLYLRAFQMAAAEKDIWCYPDACLRILKYCAADFDAETLRKIAEECVAGLEKRIEEGDHYSDRVLREAKEILEDL